MANANSVSPDGGRKRNRFPADIVTSKFKELSHAQIENIILEYESGSPSKFRLKYNHGQARKFFILRENGLQVPALSIVTACLKKYFPVEFANVGPGTFRGEERTVKAPLENKGFSVVDSNLSANPPNFECAVKKLDELDELDKKCEAARRVEQKVLRNYLLQGQSNGKCFFCGREFLEVFLHAAHIKKRAKCTDKEKRDLRNIGMLNCVFGCDQLYEHGYISVDANGKVAKSRKLMNETEKRYMKSVVRSTVTVPVGQRQYFAWHLKNKFEK